MEVILRQDVEKVGLRGEVVDVAPGYARNYLLPRRLAETATPADVAERLWETEKVRVDRRKLDLPDSIKRIGRYQVPVELFADVTATLRLAVVPEGGELPPQEELDVIAEAEAESEAAAQAESEAQQEQAEAELEAVVEEDDAESEAGGVPPEAEAEQVPDDAFDRAADAADDLGDQAE